MRAHSEGTGVLVFLSELEGARNCLLAAAEAALVLGGLPITVVHVRAAPGSVIMRTEEVLARAAIDALSHREEAKDQKLKELVVEVLGVDGAWQSVRGYEEEWIRKLAKEKTILCLQSPSHAPPGHRKAVNVALFDLEVPVLVANEPFAAAPRTSRVCGHVVVGWKNTNATQIALRRFTPFLSQARRLTVVEVGSDDTTFPSAAKAVIQPIRCDATYHIVPTTGADIGGTLIAAASELGADTLLVAAHRHGVFSDWLFGSVTETVIRTLRVPYVLAVPGYLGEANGPEA